MPSTRRQPEIRLVGVTEQTEERVQEALELVRAADDLSHEVLRPGRWPQSRTVGRFLKGDRLERVLSLYSRAMALDPREPAYPWNLASTLSRLGLNELALGFIDRAIRVAREIGDEEWADAGAELARADIAVRARQPDVAIVALARAKRLDPSSPDIGRMVKRLLGDIKKLEPDPDPVRSLTEELSRLSA